MSLMYFLLITPPAVHWSNSHSPLTKYSRNPNISNSNIDFYPDEAFLTLLLARTHFSSNSSRRCSLFSTSLRGKRKGLWKIDKDRKREMHFDMSLSLMKVPVSILPAAEGHASTAHFSLLLLLVATKQVLPWNNICHWPGSVHFSFATWVRSVYCTQYILSLSLNFFHIKTMLLCFL